MTDIEAALVERACRRLQTVYCITADRGDVEGFVALFTPEGSISVPEYPAFVGRDAIRASMQALADSGVSMRHLMSNSVIDVVDAHRATGICYLTVYNSTAEADPAGWRPTDVPATVGEYTDVFCRHHGEWRFQSRVLTRVFRRAEIPATPSRS